MKGLWRVPTRTIDPGKGLVTFDALVAFLVIIFTVVSIGRRNKQWPQAQLLHLGMILLSSWFLLHWIDVAVHSCHTRVTYSYILSSAVYNVFRTISDVFVLWGTWMVLTRYQSLRPRSDRKDNFIACTCMAGILCFLALYHLCLLFALSFAWLSFADLHVINALARARSGFEVAFTALQFCATIGTVYWAGYQSYSSLTFGFMGRIASCTIGEGAGSWKMDPYKKEKPFSVYASTALLLRSFCEIVIVGQLDRHPSHIEAIDRARDGTYGFFSILFVGCMTFAIPHNNPNDLVNMEQDAVDQVADLVTKRLEEVTEGGRRTSPNMPTLLEDLEKKERKGVKGDPYDIRNLRMKEIQRLKVLHADLEPICRWQGEDVNGAENQDNDNENDETPTQEKDVHPGRPVTARIRRMRRVLGDMVADRRNTAPEAGGRRITADRRQPSVTAII